MPAQVHYPAVELDGSVHVPSGDVGREGFLPFERPLPRRAEEPVSSPQEFKGAMSLLAGAVVMVTTYVDGRPWGLTISSCCSLTADPPQVLVSLRSSTVSCREILRSGGFGVSMLSADQRSVAEYGAAVGTAKFVEAYCESGGAVRTGPPISGALCHLHCSVVRSFAVGDHRLIVGLVHQVCRSEAQDGAHGPDPLVYFQRDFRRLGPPAG